MAGQQPSTDQCPTSRMYKTVQLVEHRQEHDMLFWMMSDGGATSIRQPSILFCRNGYHANIQDAVPRSIVLLVRSSFKFCKMTLKVGVVSVKASACERKGL